MASKHKRFTGPQVLKVEQLSGLDASIREFFDTFMKAVEPDLMTGNIATLDAKYANETAEQKKARALRYEHAYNLFMATFTFTVQQWQSELEFYRKAAMTDAAIKAEAEDKAKADQVAAILD
ncbi:MAG TPA: hypothetical protein PKV72_02170 [Candidatus Peribacteria bacterium]|nr:hypothetical protein [Candidatus Peribacteria bacterium]